MYVDWWGGTPFPELVHWTNINVILDGNNSPTPHVFRAVPLPASSSSASNDIRLKNNASSSAFHTELTPDIPTAVVAANTHTHAHFLLPNFWKISPSHALPLYVLSSAPRRPHPHFSSAERWDMFSSLLITINQWWPCLCVTLGTALSSVLPHICSPLLWGHALPPLEQFLLGKKGHYLAARSGEPLCSL